jgi:hypothetical protein
LHFIFRPHCRVWNFRSDTVRLNFFWCGACGGIHAEICGALDANGSGEVSAEVQISYLPGAAVMPIPSFKYSLGSAFPQKKN